MWQNKKISDANLLPTVGHAAYEYDTNDSVRAAGLWVIISKSGSAPSPTSQSLPAPF
jgi:hypothetical protein